MYLSCSSPSRHRRRCPGRRRARRRARRHGLAADSHAVAKDPAFAKLLGSSRFPPRDPDGRGSATILIPSSTKICYAILVHGIGKPDQAHTHRGGPSVAGPVVVP